MEPQKSDTLLNKLSYVAEIKLSYSSKVKSIDRPQIHNSQDAFELFRSHWDDDTISLLEQFKVMLLSRSSRVLGICSISQGSGVATVVDPKVIFSSAILAAAHSIILCHNHPSANLKPSQSDKVLTSKIQEGAKYFDLAVLDHVIISEDDVRYYSFADEGLL